MLVSLLSDREFVSPRIHCYAFSTASDPIYDIACRCAGIMKCDPKELNYKVVEETTLQVKKRDRNLCWGHVVRDVSPKKVMICLTFMLPQCVSFKMSK